MNTRNHPAAPAAARARVARAALLALAAAGLLAVAACNRKESDGSPALASVNGDEVTQAQLDFVLKQVQAQRPNMKPEQVEATKKQLLERMVDQRLAAQKAEKEKLDRNPAVVQALEAAKREALARVYLERLANAVPKPTPDDVKKAYDAKPGLYAQRALFTIQKVDMRAPRERAAEISADLGKAKDAADVVKHIEALKLEHTTSSTTQSSESLGPLQEKFAAMKPGDTLVVPTAVGLSALTLQSSTPQPVSMEQAGPVIEQQLWNERKREALINEGKSLRTGAKIEYLGKFAASAPAVAPMAPTGPRPAPMPAPALAPASAASH